MAKRALGKGAAALFSGDSYNPNEREIAESITPITSKKVEEKQTEQTIDVSLLKPNPHQPRTEFDEVALAELSSSIKEHGVIQPILAEAAGDGTYYIIAGERRTRAARMAGLKTVPVVLKSYSEQERLEIAIIENIQREDLNPIEEARAYKNLMELKSFSQDEAAKRVGKNRSTVANALRLLKLPEDMQNALYEKTLTAGHARALLSVVNPADQRILFARIVGTQMSVRDAEAQAAELNAGKKATAVAKKEKASAKNPNLADIEQKMIEQLGTKVQIKGSLDRGSISIEYFSADDLDSLYNKILGDK